MADVDLFVNEKSGIKYLKLFQFSNDVTSIRAR